MKAFLLCLFITLSVYSQDSFTITKEGYNTFVQEVTSTKQESYKKVKLNVVNNCDILKNCIVSEVENEYIKFKYLDNTTYSWETKKGKKREYEYVIIPELEIEFKDYKIRVNVTSVYSVGSDGQTYLVEPDQYFTRNGEYISNLAAIGKKVAIENSVNKKIESMFEETKDW
ncbi:hypothetical protein [Formosa sp. A9]|uniref:hypothetical protein n=1 Tax=Formosa sp. A9 TaxID=3442641 RepID=UPI003EBBE19B